MDWKKHITADPKILVGKPIIKGTRISVEIVIDMLSRGWTNDQIIQQYPHVTIDDIRACLAYAHEVLQSETVYFSKAS